MRSSRRSRCFGVRGGGAGFALLFGVNRGLRCPQLALQVRDAFLQRIQFGAGFFVQRFRALASSAILCRSRDFGAPAVGAAASEIRSCLRSPFGRCVVLFATTDRLGVRSTVISLQSASRQAASPGVSGPAVFPAGFLDMAGPAQRLQVRRVVRVDSRVAVDMIALKPPRPAAGPATPAVPREDGTAGPLPSCGTQAGMAAAHKSSPGGAKNGPLLRRSGGRGEHPLSDDAPRQKGHKGRRPVRP